MSEMGHKRLSKRTRLRVHSTDDSRHHNKIDHKQTRRPIEVTSALTP